MRRPAGAPEYVPPSAARTRSSRASGSVSLARAPPLELDEGDAAGAKPRASLGALQLGEPDRAAVERGDPIEVAHDQPDGADVHRRAARKGRMGGSIGRVHAPSYRRSAAATQAG